MRPIKFRAWDKVSKKFLRPWPNGFHILGETTCFDLIGMQLKERSPEKTTLEMLNDVVLMQFTGLLDKNGKEIWEGDRVKFVWVLDYSQKTVTGTVQFVDGCWDVVLDEKQYDPFLKCHTLEVIGNIYEAEQDDQETDCPIHGKCGGTDGECPRC
jgi:uncharacterized phage protein (TIGR01671 family)